MVADQAEPIARPLSRRVSAEREHCVLQLSPHRSSFIMPSNYYFCLYAEHRKVDGTFFWKSTEKKNNLKNESVRLIFLATCTLERTFHCPTATNLSRARLFIYRIIRTLYYVIFLLTMKLAKIVTPKPREITSPIWTNFMFRIYRTD